LAESTGATAHCGKSAVIFSPPNDHFPPPEHHPFSEDIRLPAGAAEGDFGIINHFGIL
jgi:hypothetical protein